MSDPRNGQDHRPVDDLLTAGVGSGPMEASRPFDPREAARAGEPADPDAPGGATSPSPARTAGSPAEEEVTADQLSLGRRLRQPRTIISLVLPLVLLVLVFRVALNVDIDDLVIGLREANALLLLAAFAVFYAGFPLRGLRWSILLRGTGANVGVRDATEIIFLSWLVNCLVPAKLGDIYRAFLLKINSTVSLSRTFGTVFIERILDLFAIATLGLAAGFWSFRNGFPTEIQFVFGIGVFVVVALAVGLLTMRNFGRRILERLPVPHRAIELYDRFEEGVFGAMAVGSLPKLITITGLIWATEAMRLFLVVEALSFTGVHLGISGAFFVALIGSLLTAVPLSPAGLGIVDLAVVLVLTAAYRVPVEQATVIALVDRAISVFSIIVLGGIAYAVSSKRRGAGLRQPVEVATA
jgi:glycosyltransferase 2 family protein